MGKWDKVKWFLRLIAGAAAAVAAAPVAPMVAAVAAVVAAGLGGVSINLPRDTWSDDQRKANLAGPYKDDGPVTK